MAETVAPDVGYLEADDKGNVSEYLGSLIVATKDNFPEEKFRVQIINGEAMTFTGDYGTWLTSDGGGTRQRIGLRLFYAYGKLSELEGEGKSAFAMVEGDALRKGGLLLGIANTIDTNSAKDFRAVEVIGQDIHGAVDEAKCAVLSGETAELGNMITGYGNFGFVINMTGKVLDIPEKRLESKNLKPGQPLVGLREDGFRANGFTKIDKTMQDLYLTSDNGQLNVLRNLGRANMDLRIQYELWYEEPGSRASRMARDWALDKISPMFTYHKELLPWHTQYPDIAHELKKPARLYTPLFYDAMGGVYGDKKVNMIAAAHITGGGVPLKGKRMVEEVGLGLNVDSVFPVPAALTAINALMALKPDLPQIPDREACESWNMGIGFLIATENLEEAKKLIDIAGDRGYEAKIAGEITDKPEIFFRNHIWKYRPKKAS